MSERYEIRVSGHLADRWGASFPGMSLIPQDDGTTVIEGAVADQSALHGLLRTVCGLALPLVSVNPTAPPIPAERPSRLPPHPTRSTT